MTTKATIITTLILIAASVFAGALLWNQLPDQIASHWNINDEVDGYMSKTWGVLLMPLVTTGMFLLFLFLPSMDPLKANIAQFRETFNLFIVFITVFMLYIHGLTLAWSLGYQNFKMGSAMLPPVGLLFIFIGYMLRKARRNFFIGIRTPWTLSSDKVWDETHRVGGKLFIASGVLALLGAFFPDYAFWFIMVPVIGTSLFTVVYSYILYQREPKA